MLIKVKMVERNLTFTQNSNDYFLEIRATSNAVAAAFGLNQDQQKILIKSFIPTTSTLHKELSLIDTLAQYFDMASIASGSILTRAKLEVGLKKWRLDISNINNLTESLRRLKSIYLDMDGGPPTSINQTELYATMIRCIKREPLPNYVLRQ